MSKQELYVSIDIEADGPIPGPYSMLSLGAAAFDPRTPLREAREPLSTFEVNLECLEGAGQDPATMSWWANQPEALEYCRKNLQTPESAMQSFVSWLDGLPGRPTLVGYPITYDFMFVYWYTVKFGLMDGAESPFGFQGLDIKTLAADRLDRPFFRVSKRCMPKHWFRGCPRHTHRALDDAIEQGILLLNMLADPQTPDRRTSRR